MAGKNLQKIDNSSFLNKAIAEAKKWLRKIELVDENARRFHDLDIRLFQDWHNLTFSAAKSKIEQAQTEYSHLVDLHNQSIYVATQKRVPLSLGLMEIMAEEERYQNGTPEERERIDKIRAVRRQAIATEMRKSQEIEDEFYRQEVDEGFVGEFRTVRDFESMSEDDVLDILSDEDFAEDFILKAFGVLIPGRRADVLRRIWNLASVALQKKIDKKLKAVLGHSAEKMMSEVEKLSAGRRKSRPEDNSAKKESIAPSTAKTESARNEEAKLLASKHFFRKIARRIHPDKLDLSSDLKMKEWFNSTWQSVISAHNREDAEELRVLYHKILIVLNDYSDLDVSDIREAAVSLKNEHGLALRRTADMKNHPAWNFSKLKDFSKIEKREGKVFADALRSVTVELAEMREAHEELREEAEYLRDRMQAKKVRRRSNRSRRR